MIICKVLYILKVFFFFVGEFVNIYVNGMSEKRMGMIYEIEIYRKMCEFVMF